MKNNKLKKLENLKLRTSTFGLRNKLGIVAIVCLLIFAGYSGVNATIKLGEDGSGQKWFGSSPGEIIHSNGKSWTATGDNIQIAIDDEPGVVTVPSGTFIPTATIVVPSGVWLKGQGNSTIIEQDIRLESHTSHNKVSDLTITTGRITVYNGHDRVIENVNVIGTNNTYAFLIYANAGKVNNTRFLNCQAINCENFGWFTNGEGVPCLIENLTIDNCLAVGCGDGVANNWSCGFHLAEWAGMTLRNCIVTNCIAHDCWETGFHTEIAPIKENFIISNCISEGNGIRKPSSTFGSGFTLQNATVSNCIAIDNDKRGFQLLGGVVHMSNCVSYGAYYSLALSGLDNSTIQGCTFSNSTHSLVFTTSSCSNLIFDNNIFRDCNGADVIINAGTGTNSYWTFSNNRFINLGGVQRGIYYSWSTGWLFNGNIFYNVTGTNAGIELGPSTTFVNNIVVDCDKVITTHNRFKINNNRFISSVDDSIYVGSVSDGQINDNYIYNAGGEGIETYIVDDIQINGNYIQVTGGNGIEVGELSYRTLVNNNCIQSCSGHGIYLYIAHGGSVCNNYIYSSVSSGIYFNNVDNFTCSNNVCQDNGADGIYADLVNGTLTGNRCYGNVESGIELDDTGASDYADYCTVTDNNCLGNTGANIIIDGSHNFVSNNMGFVTESSGANASTVDGGTINHGLVSNATYVLVTGSVAADIVSVTAIGATTFTVAIKDHAGNAGTSQTIYWRAYYKP